MAELGKVRNHGFDRTGHERRERLAAVMMCPDCCEEVECWQETEGWTEAPEGRWQHLDYGPAHGVCKPCGVLLVDSWDGAAAYHLPPKKGT